MDNTQAPAGPPSTPKEQRVNRRIAAGMFALAVLPLVAGGALAQQPPQTQHKEMSVPETAYQAGGSPLAGVDMYQDINPKAPPMSKA